MTKQKFANLYAAVLALLQKTKTAVVENNRKLIEISSARNTPWWQIALGVIISLFFLYYPLGGLLVHNIDTSSSYQPKTLENKLASVDMMSHLINREVHYKIWTPNLPFMFPSYFLDNMPNFQLGLMSAVGKTADALNKLSFTTASAVATDNLADAAGLLQYPGNIWLFSPQNKLLPVPSANTQYKKGRKKLNNFNNEIAAGKITLPRNAQNLSLILQYIKKDISRLVVKTENHIRENNDSFTDFKADDTFYFALGKLYAYSQIIKSLGYDFKDVLISHDVYQQWTAALRFLQEASDLKPAIVRNGNLNSSFAPNHLVTINYLASRTVNRLNTIINKLNQPMDIKE